MNEETASRYNRTGMSYEESWINRGLRGTRRLLRDTPIECILIGVASAACTAVLSYGHEVERSHNVPLAFSEITQLERQAKADGKEIGAMSEYYAKVSDSVMKILEASNISWKENPRNNLVAFAKELKNRTTKESDYGSKHTYTINDLLEAMPELADNASRTMGGFTKNLSLVHSLNQELDASWTESHVNHYRTEFYINIETYSDSAGHIHTRSVPKAREVYDHTTHTYDYHQEHGEKASALFAELKNNLGELGWPENLLVVRKINQPNQDAIVISRIRGEKVPNLSKTEMLDLVNAWNHGSTYNQNKQRINSGVESIPDSEDKWHVAKTTARSIWYNTNFRSDSGPIEYRLANNIIGQMSGLERGVSEIMFGINQVNSQAPGLKKAIRDYIDMLISVESTGVKIDPEETQKAIIKTVKSWYSTNIKGGFDVDMFRWHCVVLWGLFGAFAGGLAGAGVNALGSRFNWYKDSERDAEA